MDPAEDRPVRVEVVYSPLGRTVDRVELTLVEGSTALQALQASGLLQRYPAIDLTVQRLGLWGRLCPPGELLRDGDRVELYRPLTVDPKEARRLRYRRQSERQGARKPVR
ncbi:RnfH family protein [Methylibium sp.]|uniref:RnfH family protein n=1 Tax=Methylibium sp. TaxID=2067992 RepID=UPI003D0A8334